MQLLSLSLHPTAPTGVSSSSSSSPAVTSKVFFDITIDGEASGRITIGLYGGVVPRCAVCTVPTSLPHSSLSVCSFPRYSNWTCPVFAFNSKGAWVGAAKTSRFFSVPCLGVICTLL